MKHLKEYNIFDLKEGVEGDLANQREVQNEIRADITRLKEEEAEIDRDDDDQVTRAIKKQKVIRNQAARIVDLARSMELEADLAVKVAKERDKSDQEEEIASQDAEAEAPTEEY